MPRNIFGRLYYTLEEVADELEVSIRTVYNYVYRNELTVTQVGRNKMVLDDDMEDFLDSQRLEYDDDGGSGLFE